MLREKLKINSINIVSECGGILQGVKIINKHNHGIQRNSI